MPWFSLRILSENNRLNYSQQKHLVDVSDMEIGVSFNNYNNIIMTPEEQRDNQILDTMNQFIDKFTIQNDDKFKKEAIQYMDSTRMGKESFLRYLDTIKKSFTSPIMVTNKSIQELVPEYILIVDRIIKNI